MNKDFFTGLIIFLVPVTIFIKPVNLRQLVILDFYIIIFSLIVVLLALVIFSILLNFFIKKIIKKRPHSIFLLCSFGFYLLFFFIPLRKLFINTIFSQGGASYFSIILLFLIWLATCIAVLSLKNVALIFQKILFIFACIIISFSLLSNLFYFSEFWKIKPDTEIKTKQVFLNFDEVNKAFQKNILHRHNIYYVILDGMLSLEFAAKLDIVDEVKAKTVLQQAGLNYIDKSYSSYNTTYLTLASIMEVDHPVTDQSARYSKREDFFPGIMYQDKKTVPLPDFISKIGNDFFWLGSNTEGSYMLCQEWVNQPWICIDYSKTMNILRRLSRTIYYNTPLSFILKTKFIFPNKQIDPQRTMKFYINYSKKNIDINSPKFVFLHHMSPHAPHLVSEHCEPKQHAVKFEGYKASYNCVLKEVLEFMKYINTFDPNSIVVFQGDHGIKDDLLKKYKTSEEKLFFKASIFNALKAPKECFEKFKKPSTNVNTIRFVLNCAYGLNLPLFETIHYEGFYEAHPEYGKVFAHIF